jgi:hypothetical protein
MPWVCETCREYTQNEAEKPCPKCGRERKFTLLSAPGAEPEPVADAPTTLQNRYGHGDHQTRNSAQPYVQDPGWEGFVYPLLVVLGFIAFIAGFVYYFVLR